MPSPAQDPVAASKLWLALSSTERPSKIVDFPRNNADGKPVGQVRIRVLTQEEQMAANLAAESTAKEHIKDGKKGEIGYERLFSDAFSVEILYRACRELDTDVPAFPTPKQMRAMLTTEECAALFQHYLTIQLELGPMATSMTDAECEAWITRVEESGSVYPLDLLPSEQLKILFRYMVNQLRPSPKDSSSAGEPAVSST